MTSILEKMNFDNCIQIHNSHIICRQYLQSFGKNSLMISHQRIPVSEKYKTYLSRIIE